MAGSSQFVAISMTAAGATASQIILATFLLNLRHLLMGASLAPYLVGVKFWKLAILGHFLNDESYALTISRFQLDFAFLGAFIGLLVPQLKDMAINT
ncbi:AzlC family ABC transporter permease [Thermanaeromonas toyohensis]|uniref:AzlC family ABC transporter permease n=1 Tax=Thermanaeromonas toyohensis TaxID=161154 RepID=UPI0022B2651C|nr:AzlC family ABC transporter permease [Thermanaeromonas toyohensis]